MYELTDRRHLDRRRLLLCRAATAPRKKKTPSTSASPAPTDCSGTNRQPPPNEMIRIPAGGFQMGDKEEADAKPHEVTVNAFSWTRTS